MAQATDHGSRSSAFSAARPSTVLVFGESKFACLFLTQFLEQDASLSCRYGTSLAEVLRLVDEGLPSVMVRAPFLADQAILDSVEALREEPSLSEVPLILYGELDQGLELSQWLAARVTDFVPASAGLEQLRQRVLELCPRSAPEVDEVDEPWVGVESDASVPPRPRRPLSSVPLVAPPWEDWGDAPGGSGEPTPATRSDVPSSVPVHSLRVFMVDDSRTICLSCREKIIHHPDVVFDFCTDPREALERAQAFDPNVVLMDLEMPGLSGFELLPQFKSDPTLGDVPVIVLSGIGDPIIKADLFRLGANDYAEKNMDEVELYSRIFYHSQACITRRRLKQSIEELVETQKRLENQRNFIRKTFGRYLSDAVVSNILETPEGLDLGGEKRVISIMMADLRGFTSLSERLPPETVLAIINNFLREMTDLLFQYEGTIDEFLGDAILAMFGAPIGGIDDAARAVACAVAMQLAMVKVNEWNEAHGYPPVALGIGINTGEVVVGNIGSERRAKYGIVGRNVNLTARIESCTVGGQIMVSHSTLEACGSLLRVEGQHQVAVKGVAEPITVYEVVGVGGEYNLYLPAKEEEELPLLTPPLEAHLTVVEGKRSSSDAVPGRLVRWLHDKIHLETDLLLEPLTDLKISLLDEKGEKIRDDLYGKVISTGSPSPEVLTVCLTSIPPAAQAFLARHQRRN